MVFNHFDMGWLVLLLIGRDLQLCADTDEQTFLGFSCNKIFERTIVNDFFYPCISINLCFGSSKEASH